MTENFIALNKRIIKLLLYDSFTTKLCSVLMKNGYMRNLVIALSLLLFQASAWATHDVELMHSMRCLKLFRPYEHKYNIPSDTLHSISLQESGRMHSAKRTKMAWPWTVNVEGKGHHFDSKKEAVRFVKRELAQGKRSIDVGCMQVNLKQHPDAFSSIEEAFDPRSNINYGASFLRSKYEQLGSWSKAIAHYHSATPALGVPYKDKVIKIARNIDKYKVAFREDIKRSIAPKNYKTEAALQYRPKEYERVKKKRYRSSMMIHVPRT